MKVKLIIIGLILLIAQRSFCQNTGSISGNVKTEWGEPLAFSNVVLIETKQGINTNELGQFLFTNISPGAYTLLISAIGYSTLEEKITVKAVETSDINIILKSNDLQLETVTVTAEKREDELQKVPLSVTAVDAKKIEALQISNINEIGRITPNFKINDDGGGSSPIISTRGITTLNQNSVIGVYIDGVPQFNIQSLPTYFNDIERIEVLKGPQGTLYGRNSIGGILNITSKKPTNITKGFVTTGYGNLNQYELQAGINVPVIKDKLFFRLNGGTTGRDGYIENTFLNNTELLGRKVNTGNLRLVYLPNAKWNLTFNSGFENRKVNATAYIGGVGANANVIDSLFTNKPFQVRQNTNGIYTTNISNNSFNANFSSEKFDFAAITAVQYTHIKADNDDFDNSEFDILQMVRRDRTLSTISQELRISSNTNKKLKWIGGAYLYTVRENTDERNRNGADNALFFPDPTIAAQYPYEQINTNSIVQNGFSLFGQASYEISKKLILTTGIRYELENSRLKAANRYERNGTDFVFPPLAAVPQTFEESTLFGAISPKINLAYQANIAILCDSC